MRIIVLRRSAIMALKAATAFAVVALLVLYTQQQTTTSSDPHFQRETRKRYSADSAEAADAAHSDKKLARDSAGDGVCHGCGADGKVLVHLAVVACGDRMPETVVLLKSAVMFSTPFTRFHFHLFTEDHLKANLTDALTAWPSYVTSRFAFTIRPITFPATEDFQKWKELFKPCASQRLFFPNILQDQKLLLYVDTDILFLAPVHLIWSHFEKFNRSQLAALSPEHEDKSMGWYNRFAMHPYYGELGVNSGVMLMDLERMRESRWEKNMIQFQEKYQYKIVWGDQDLINVFFARFPEKLYLYSCRWNYRPDHCMYMQNCHDAVENGVAVLHGNRRSFHTEKQLAFKAVYDAVAAYRFDGGDAERDVVRRLAKELAELEGKSRCAAYDDAILKTLRKSIKNVPSLTSS